MDAADNLREVLIERSVPLVKARIAQYELHEAINELLETVPPETQELAPDIQYGCFLEACTRAGVDPQHPAFDPFRAHYKAVIEHNLFVTALMN